MVKIGGDIQRYKGMKVLDHQWKEQKCSHLPRMFSLTKNQSQSREDAWGQWESIRESPASRSQGKQGWFWGSMVENLKQKETDGGQDRKWSLQPMNEEFLVSMSNHLPLYVESKTCNTFCR